MDISALGKGKEKGKQRGKDGGKYGKGKEKGKYGKDATKLDDANKKGPKCFYCGKMGHVKSECLKKKADQNSKGSGKSKDKGKGQTALEEPEQKHLQEDEWLLALTADEQDTEPQSKNRSSCFIKACCCTSVALDHFCVAPLLPESDILSLSSDIEWLLVDSGAAASTCPPSYAADAEYEDTPPTRYRGASGEAVMLRGRRRVR